MQTNNTNKAAKLAANIFNTLLFIGGLAFCLYGIWLQVTNNL